MARRGFKLDVETLRALEEKRKSLQIKTEELQAERNARSKSIGIAKSKGEDIQPLLAEVEHLGDALTQAKTDLNELQTQLNDIIAGIPNLADDAVPVGKDESENVEVTL